jgi:S1-C subfamily serine protease
MSGDDNENEDGAEEGELPAFDEVAVTSAFGAVVALHSHIPESALTASILGTERAGHGVAFGDAGLILTIGYLVTEAESVFVTTAGGQTLQAHVVAYDQETGFGIVQALGRLDVTPLQFGRSADLVVGETVVLAGHGGKSDAVYQEIIARREFAGYWEYLLEDALFTSPAHQNWGGAALLNHAGHLVGIGSLLVQHMGSSGAVGDANMVVPIDLLPPILDDLVMYGRVQKPARPWLGLITVEHQGGLVVASISQGGPSEACDIEVGDVIAEIAGQPVSELAPMFRLIWGLGEAGVEVPLTLERDGQSFETRVASADRNHLLHAPLVH